MRAATEGSLPPVIPQGNLVEVLGREVRQGWPGDLMVENSPSCQRRPPCNTYDFSSCFSPKFKNSAKKGIFAGNDLFVWFLRPQNTGGGVLSTQLLSKGIKNPEMWPILGYFCLLWAGPAEQCCTPVYLPIEDF